MVDSNAFSQFETLSKTFLCSNLTTVCTPTKSCRHQSGWGFTWEYDIVTKVGVALPIQLSFATLDLELHSKYVRMALEGQPTIVVDDLFVVDHFILNPQTRRVAPLFIWLPGTVDQRCLVEHGDVADEPLL
ncbi:hypothetical protein HanXRQr2_Chr11g0509711 [Helianthus annuus]|uniref:Uncharacterized protein n=2 Tax=Helianthus annuus TaxID=4232 RepID=A0A251TE58_HELAN|nr:hypothetical protein HanXRQr2_Chr11g0509711 [Helianthus annuus]KAJ0876656.1 hypothetical protein HanPSC8_Chr11g0490981 [Helianthus annuus]